MSDSNGRSLGRRQFLGGAGGLVLVVVGGPVLTACASGSSGSTSGTSVALTSVALTTGTITEFTNFFVADKLGLFKKHGVNADLQGFIIAKDGALAMLAGQKNTATIVELPFLSYLANGADLVTVAVVSTARNIKLVCKSSIKGPRDLVGKKIGYPFGTGQDYGFNAYLKLVGVDAASVHSVNVDNASIVPVLARGDIDGFLGVDPQVSQALSQVDGSHVLANPPAASGYVSRAHLVLERKFATANRKAVQGVLAALIEANQYVTAHPSESAQIMSVVLHLSPDKVQALIKGNVDDYKIYLDDASVQALHDVGQFLVDKGKIKAIPDISKAVDSSYLKAVDSSAVTLSRS